MNFIKKIFKRKDKKNQKDCEQTELEYLFELYGCEDIETLEARRPMVVNATNMDKESVEEFKALMGFAESKEDRAILKLVKERNHIKTNYNFDKIKVSVNE